MSKETKSILNNLEKFSFLSENWKQIGIIFSLVVLISFLFPRGDTLKYSYKLNDITREPIIAPFTFPILKTADNYEQDKKAEKKAVPFIFNRSKNIVDKKKPLLMDYIDPKKITYLPNTAGCFTSKEALRTLRLAREIGGWKLVKLEVLGDKKNLFPDMIETLKSTEVLTKEGKWPCFFFESNTTGEKDFEEFFTEDEIIDLDRFHNIGIIKSELKFEQKKLETFLLEIEKMKKNQLWRKKDLVALFNKIIPNFNHLETDKYLDDRM